MIQCDQRIIKKAQQGNAEALAELLRDHYTFLHKYLLKVTLDPSLAEDICQDTMLRSMEKITSYNGASSFSSWLITIATRLYIDRIRRSKREKEWNLRQEQGIRTIRWQFESRNEEWSDVLDAISRLPLPQRMAVLLKHYYGYGYEEIGAMLQIPEGTVKSRVAYGLRQLRKELGEDE
ncbi:RNA polymerase sigma factor SigY [Paenibacillus wynnii]|uniref:RNA polymerase sigma factor SigY n=1 Tax=Paenibacillus wynnii TaxID=268407 RepID=A0A098MEH1_9BACL|nr:RNA polymerase sigma factor SigY [Paenibacillus wynnii]KGE20944.1 RNA polymerase sigma factor SigY [Paenibacillus wynnii]